MEPKDLVIAIRAHGLTQTQIFEKTGIPQPTVSKIERGEVDDVMSRNYRALESLHGELEDAARVKAAGLATAQQEG
jgi:predicted transcriptional regulator